MVRATTLGGCALLSLVLTPTLTPVELPKRTAIGGAAAFRWPFHEAITRAAAQGFSQEITSGDLNLILVGNRSQDCIQTYYDSQERHFTSSYFKWGLEYLHREWARIEATDNRLQALLSFGKVLHATQDFYSHSNWVEIFVRDNPKEAKIAVWDMKLSSLPSDVWSGYWPSDDSSFSLRSDAESHEDSAKDHPDSKQGKKTPGGSGPNANRTYHELSVEVATMASKAQFARLAGIIVNKTTCKIDDVLVWPRGLNVVSPASSAPDPVDFELGVAKGAAYLFAGEYYFRYSVKEDALDAKDPSKPKPLGYIREKFRGIWTDGIDASVPWPRRQTVGFHDSVEYRYIYFFKGAEYVRYNVQSGRPDDGYPKPISLHWPKLWPNGIDAAVNWDNGYVYFFKGPEYIKFDVNADHVVAGYPKSIAAHWPGLWADGVDAAVNWGNGKVYFLKGDHYIRWDLASGMDAGYPRPISGSWGGF